MQLVSVPSSLGGLRGCRHTGVLTTSASESSCRTVRRVWCIWLMSLVGHTWSPDFVEKLWSPQFGKGLMLRLCVGCVFPWGWRGSPPPKPSSVVGFLYRPLPHNFSEYICDVAVYFGRGRIAHRPSSSQRRHVPRRRRNRSSSQCR